MANDRNWGGLRKGACTLITVGIPCLECEI